MSAPLRPADELARNIVSDIAVAMSMCGPHVYSFTVAGVRCNFDDEDEARKQRKRALDAVAALVDSVRAERSDR